MYVCSTVLPVLLHTYMICSAGATDLQSQPVLKKKICRFSCGFYQRTSPEPIVDSPMGSTDKASDNIASTADSLVGSTIESSNIVSAADSPVNSTSESSEIVSTVDYSVDSA
jgi:hypothetical protein